MGLFDITFITNAPTMAADTDAISIAILAEAAYAVPPNARFAMNIDIVNPMPPKHATPNSVPHEPP